MVCTCKKVIKGDNQYRCLLTTATVLTETEISVKKREKKKLSDALKSNWKDIIKQRNERLRESLRKNVMIAQECFGVLSHQASDTFAS